MGFAYIADTGWRRHKPLRFLWRSFCWYLVYSAAMYILMLGSYVAALPSEIQSCVPAMVLTRRWRTGSFCTCRWW